MTAQKDDYIGQLKKQYDELNFRWSRQRDKFEADIQHVSADGKKEFEANREAYRKYRKALEEKIGDLESASDNAWEDLKDGAEKSWKALSQAFDNAASHFKK